MYKKYFYKPPFKKKSFLRKIFQAFFMPLGYYIVEKVVFENKTLNRGDMNASHIYSYLKKFLNKKIFIFDVGAHIGQSVYFFKELTAKLN